METVDHMKVRPLLFVPVFKVFDCSNVDLLKASKSCFFRLQLSDSGTRFPQVLKVCRIRSTGDIPQSDVENEELPKDSLEDFEGSEDSNILEHSLASPKIRKYIK